MRDHVVYLALCICILPMIIAVVAERGTLEGVPEQPPGMPLYEYAKIVAHYIEETYEYQPGTMYKFSIRASGGIKTYYAKTGFGVGSDSSSYREEFERLKMENELRDKEQPPPSPPPIPSPPPPPPPRPSPPPPRPSPPPPPPRPSPPPPPPPPSPPPPKSSPLQEYQFGIPFDQTRGSEASFDLATAIQTRILELYRTVKNLNGKIIIEACEQLMKDQRGLLLKMKTADIILLRVLPIFYKDLTNKLKSLFNPQSREQTVNNLLPLISECVKPALIFLSIDPLPEEGKLGMDYDEKKGADASHALAAAIRTRVHEVITSPTGVTLEKIFEGCKQLMQDQRELLLAVKTADRILLRVLPTFYEYLTSELNSLYMNREKAQRENIVGQLLKVISECVKPALIFLSVE